MKFLIVCLTILCGFGCAKTYTQQTVTGDFTALNGQRVKLMGYSGFETYVIDSTRANQHGNFVLSFGAADYGMAYLTTENGKAFVVILAPDENLNLQGESLALPHSVKIISGKQNRLFETYASEHVRREQARSAWDYLDKIYQQDSLFAVNQLPRHAIEAEIVRIKQEDENFLNQLDPNTYVSWFLPMRKLVSSVSPVAQYRTDEIPETIAAFRALDYTDDRLYKSGLLGDAIEAHFWLIENSGRSLDSVYVEMNHSIDLLLAELAGVDEKKFNDITAYLFELLERRSLFTSSEYLAVKVLNEGSCTLNDKLASQLESYRAMKKGNTAPDFEFKGDVVAPAYDAANFPAKLSDLTSDYTLVVFGAGWCPKCSEELAEIAKDYPNWKANGVEVVFVSLDEDKKLHQSFTQTLPFISVCDFKKWESPIVDAYHVFATPTMFLLDKNRKILLRPNSAKQMEAWVDWFLVQGNG
ncbi:MAG: redoxin domain-containing protein [Bacteroidales bacterium]|jgi:peroxiredoxin